MECDRESFEAQCPVRATVRLLGGKYKSVILWTLMSGTKRFGEIHAVIPEATGKMMTKQLRELEADGLIERKVYAVVPPKTEYSLTEFGRSAIPVIMSMKDWGVAYMDRMGMEVPDEVRDAHGRD